MLFDTAFTHELIRMVVMMIVNLAYSTIAIGIGITAMRVAYSVFDRLTPFNTGEMLEKDPKAVGMVVAGILIGVGVCSGLIIGLATS